MNFNFLKYCLGNEVDMSELVAKMDWRQLYAFAKKQALIGFCFLLEQMNYTNMYSTIAMVPEESRAMERLAVFYHKPTKGVIDKAQEWFGNENVVEL